MHFVYQGFTHEGDTRSFRFQGIDGGKLGTNFSIGVSLPLFARYRVALQDAPEFCLHLLTEACASAPDALLKLQRYQVLEEDLLPIVKDRETRARTKALKPSPRRFGRKPAASSQLRPSTRFDA
jgi:hypothetical protein